MEKHGILDDAVSRWLDEDISPSIYGLLTPSLAQESAADRSPIASTSSDILSAAARRQKSDAIQKNTSEKPKRPASPMSLPRSSARVNRLRRDACDKHFTTSRALRSHCAETHRHLKEAGIEPMVFICPHCAQRCSRADNLKRHLRTKHGKANVDRPQTGGTVLQQEVYVEPDDDHCLQDEDSHGRKTNEHTTSGSHKDDSFLSNAWSPSNDATPEHNECLAPVGLQGQRVDPDAWFAKHYGSDVSALKRCLADIPEVILRRQVRLATAPSTRCGLSHKFRGLRLACPWSASQFPSERLGDKFTRV